MKLTKIKPDFMDDRGTISDIFYQDKIDHVAYIKSFSKFLIKSTFKVCVIAE